MRRGWVGLAAVVTAAMVGGTYTSTVSALGSTVSPNGSNSLRTQATPPVKPVAADAAAPQAAPTDTQSEVESTKGGGYSTAGAIAATGWQMAVGAYYFGGELVETGGIIGTGVANMLGLMTTPTAPPPTAATTSGDTGLKNTEAKNTEDRRYEAWSKTGHSNLTPTLDKPVPVTPAHEKILPVAQEKMMPAPQPPAAKPHIETVALGTSATGKSAEPPVSTCGWPALHVTENRDAETATLAKLTDLGLLEEPSVRLPDGGVFLPKVAQRLLQIRTGIPCKGGVNTSRALVGHVIADPAASGLVQAGQDGRIEAAPWGLPKLGQHVNEGEILGYLRPIWPNRDLSAVQSEVATIRGEIAEKELELARSRELPLLPFREGRILSIRLELDKLRRKRDALVEGIEAALPIVASATGVIARADARVGQVVEPQHLLWEIVAEQRLWVEADWFGVEPPGKIATASAVRADGSTIPLAFEGSGWALNQQKAPIQFRVAKPISGLRLGERVTVLIDQPIATDGVLVPRSALVRRDNGETGIWAAISAERFETYRVRWRSVDGSVVAVEAGLPANARIVVNGATLLSEIR